MEERSTVRMDGSDDQGVSPHEAKTPPTIPIDDILRQQQRWPSAPPAPQPSAPAGPQYTVPAGPPSPPQGQPFAPPPFRPPAAAVPAAGATRVMGPPPPPPLLAWLAVTDGPGAARGQVFTLQPETVIGRAAGHIVLSGDSYVSGQHAKIRLEPSEADPEKKVLVLYDLASANGTFAGSRETYRDKQIYRHELHDGDYVLVGETSLVFKQV